MDLKQFSKQLEAAVAVLEAAKHINNLAAHYVDGDSREVDDLWVIDNQYMSDFMNAVDDYERAEKGEE